MNISDFPKIENGIEHILNPPEAGFASWDWVVLVAYFATIVVIGFAFSYQRKKAKKSDSAEEYFKGSGQIPGWVAGMSIWATTLSAITYMATPANAFVGSWIFAFGNITIFLFAPILIIYIVPFFRHINATTAYEYLEQRFSYIIRALGSVMFIGYHIFRIAIVIYLPTLAFGTILPNVSPFWIAAFIGIISLIYTVVAGIKGVVWTEAVQGFVLLAGIILIIGFAISGILAAGVTWSEFLNNALANNKFMGGEGGGSAWKITLVGASIPIIFLGQLINTSYQYVGSQDVVQRYQTSKSSNEVNKGIWVNAFLAILTIFLFYGAGTLLWGYYDANNYLYLFAQSPFFDDKNIIGGWTYPDGGQVIFPEGGHLDNFVTNNILPGAGQKTDNVLPFFVLTALPVAVTGLIIAALFAACQSTIASSLNAVGTCFTVDFIQYHKKDIDETKIVKISQIIMILVGLFATFVCLMMIVSGVYNLLNFFIALIGGFGAPVFGMFFLGMFTTRANKQGTLIGGVIGSAVGIGCFFISSTMIMETPLISSLWTPIFAFFTVAIIGYVLSIVLDFGDKKGYWTLKKNKDKTNLTVWSWTADTKNLIKEEKLLNKDENKYNKNCKKIKWQNRYIKFLNKLSSKNNRELITIPEKTYLDKYEHYFKEMTLLEEFRKQEKVDELKAWKEAKQK